MTRSGPLLAKRLVKPTWLHHPTYVETFGPEVADVCGAAGFYPDPEQQLMLDIIFAIGLDGKSAAFDIDIIGPRQNFKTGLIKQAELGWLFVTQERLIVHSAHELSTTEEAFGDLRKLIEEAPVLAKHLDPTIGDKDSPGIILGNGRWAIHLAGDIRIKYKARTRSGGRGLTGNKIVLDEGFALTSAHIGSLYPTLAAVPDPQVLTASSAGLLESVVLRGKRDRGRAGTSPRQAYVEYGDKFAHQGCKNIDCDHHVGVPGCVLDDEKRWKQIMPAIGRRVDIETIRAFRESMPPKEFAQEFMVWWEDPPTEGTGIIDLDAWASMRLDSATAPTGPVVLFLDVSPDRRSTTIGLASEGPNGRTMIMAYTAGGTSWAVPKLVQLKEAKGDLIREVALHPSSQAGALIPALVAAGIEFEALNNQMLGAACASFQIGIPEGRYAHPGVIELDAAVANAKTRFSGEVELWDRRKPDIDISPLVACSTAAYRWELLGGHDYDVLDSIG